MDLIGVQTHTESVVCHICHHASFHIFLQWYPAAGVICR